MIVGPSPGFGGRLRVPGDKSVTHRALMIGAVATGSTEIVHPGGGEDNLATARALSQLGVEVLRPDAEHIVVRGVGLHGLRTPSTPIDCANSGTTVRLLSGLLAGAGITAEFTGDSSLRRRPMGRVAEPLADLGYEVVAAGPDGTLPLRLSGAHEANPAAPVRAVLRIASAQVKSCLLLCGLHRTGVTEVVEPAVSRDHTERLLRAFGLRCESSAHYLAPERASRTSELAPWSRLHRVEPFRGRSVEVPGDISSAAFPLAAAALIGTGVTVERVGVNPTRAGVVRVLQRMGAPVAMARRATLSSGEPAADLRVAPASLRATEIGGDEIPSLIDEIPVLCVLGAASSGRFSVRNARELRVKESDRVEETAKLLRALGVEATLFDDGLEFDGRGRANWAGFEADAAGDHRMALAATVAALAASSPSRVRGAEAIAVSWPGFAEQMRALGGDVRGERGGIGLGGAEEA